MQPVTVNPATLRDVLAVLFRQKHKIVAFAGLVMLTVFLASVVAPAVYQSEAKILVRLGRESLGTDPTVTGQGSSIVSVGQVREAELQSEVEILRSVDLPRLIVDTFGTDIFLKPVDPPPEERRGFVYFLRHNYNRLASVHLPWRRRPTTEEAARLEIREQAIKNFQKNLIVEVNRRSNIIEVSFEGYSPVLTQQVLEKLIDAYLDKHIAVYRVPGSKEFFAQQSEKLKQLKTDLKEKLKDLKISSGITTLQDAQQLAQKRLNELRQDLERAEESLAASQARSAALKTMLVQVPTHFREETTGITNQAAARMRERLFELKVQEERLASKYREGTEPLLAIRREIEKAEAVLKTENPTLNQVKSGVNQVYQQIQGLLLTEEANVRSDEAKCKKLRELNATALEDLKRLTEQAVEITNLETEIRRLEDNYLKYSDKTEQARINEALEMERISNISVVQAPTRPVEPIRPRRRLNIILGAVLGLLGGIGVAYLADFLDHSIKDPRDLQAVGIPVLAYLPHLTERK